MPKRVSKIVVINHRQEVLLLLRGATAPTRALTWDLPGGVTEADETPLESAVRELQEETDIMAQATELQVVHSFLAPSLNKWTIYRYVVNDPKVKISWEHDRYIWHPLDQINSLDDLPKHLNFAIQKAANEVVEDS